MDDPVGGVEGDGAGDVGADGDPRSAVIRDVAGLGPRLPDWRWGPPWSRAPLLAEGCRQKPPMSPDFGFGVGCQGGGGDRFFASTTLLFSFVLGTISRHSSLFKQREDPLLRL